MYHVINHVHAFDTIVNIREKELSFFNPENAKDEFYAPVLTFLLDNRKKEGAILS